MTDGHFTLDVDPDGLRAVAERIGRLREHLRQKGTAARQVPGDIGERWTGDAATGVKAEMTGIGDLMHDLQTRLQPVAAELRTLAGHYDDALARLPGLNQRWQAAHDDYAAAVRSADTAADRAGEDPANDRQDTQRARNNAVGDAAEDRRKTLHALETDVAYMKLWLRQETAKLAAVMVTSEPIGVTDDQIEQWRAGQAPVLDRAGLLGGLGLMGQRMQLLAEQELEAERAEKREEAEDDVEALQDALEDGDPEAVNAALESIAGRSDDDIYSEQLVDLLGPGGVQDLYLQIDQGLKDSTLYFEEIWPSLEGFNNTVANGISQQPDDEFADFVEDWMDEDYGPKMWALIAASDQADGRVNAIALAYHSEVYNASLSDAGGMPGLYPQAYNYAYGDEDMLAQWDDRSSGADLADVLEHASDEHVDDLLFRMLNVQTDGGTMNEDDYQHIADLYGETLLALRDRHLAALEESDGARPDLLMRLLEDRYRNTDSQYFDPIRPYLADLVNNPEWALWYLNNSRDGFVDASTFKDLIDESGADVNELIATMTTYQIQRGDDPEQVATNLGLLLRSQDLLGDGIKLDGVLKSLAESAISATLGSNPLTGPAMGVFNALLSEIQRLEEADQSLDDAMSKNAVQEIYAFTIYTQVHGGPPPGFDAYVEREGLQDDERAINLYMQHLEEQGGEVWEELQNLTTLIDESRDEE